MHDNFWFQLLLHWSEVLEIFWHWFVSAASNSSFSCPLWTRCTQTDSALGALRLNSLPAVAATTSVLVTVQLLPAPSEAAREADFMSTMTTLSDGWINLDDFTPSSLCCHFHSQGCIIFKQTTGCSWIIKRDNVTFCWCRNTIPINQL